jgi:hypothetical protein
LVTDAVARTGRGARALLRLLADHKTTFANAVCFGAPVHPPPLLMPENAARVASWVELRSPRAAEPLEKPCLATSAFMNVADYDSRRPCAPVRAQFAHSSRTAMAPVSLPDSASSGHFACIQSSGAPGPLLAVARAMTKHAGARTSRLGFLTILGAIPLGACAYDVGSGDGTVVTEVRQPSYFYSAKPLFTTNNWEVPVCYHPASTGSSQAKALFEQTVREQWEANTGLRLTGFQTCTSTASPWVPVYIVQSSGNRFGNAQPGVGARQGTNSNGWPADSQVVIGYDAALQQLPYVAAHEMGHAIGVVHEHQRPDGDDMSNRCVLPRSGGDGVVIPGQLFATVDDPLSVMHYCWTANGANYPSQILTQLDIIGGQMIYGRPSTATAELGFQRVVLSGIPPAFSFNSTGATNSFTHDGPGRYTATFPRMGQVGGNVQVTPYNSLNRCNIVWWSSGFSGGASTAVNCYNAAGTLTDTEFTVSFVGRWDGPGVVEGGYVWAYDPSSSFYTATGSYTWNSTGQPVTISRVSTGVYDVLFGGQSFNGGTVELSAYGGGTEYCKLDSIARIGSDKRVRVRCFSRTGTPVDTFYSLRLSSGSPMGTPSYSYALADQPSNTQVYTPASTNRLAYRQNMIGGTPNLAPLTVRRFRAGGYIVDLPQMPYTNDPLYLYKKSNLHVTAVGTGNEYCQVSSLSGDSLGQDEQATQALVICMNPAGTAFVDSRFIISYGSMLVDAPDSTILSTVERLPQNGALGIGGLSLVSNNLYFTRSYDNVAGGQIMRLSTSGGTPTSLVAGESAIGLFADANNLIWLGSNNTVKKSTLSGATITTLASNQSLLNGNPTADANNVYYRQAVSQMGSGQKIMKVSRNGGTPVMLTSDDVTSELFSDGTSVYWSARTATGGRIAKISVNGGTVTVLDTRGGGALVRRNSTLYYNDNATNDLYKVSTAGGTATRIATGLPLTAAVSALATDGTNVYGAFSNPGNAIFRANVNGGSPLPAATFLAFHEHSRSPLALGTSSVYFVGTTGLNGYLTVSRTTK